MVNGPRQETYGHPLDDYTKVGGIWGYMLREWRDSDEEAIPPRIACLMMQAVKISREINGHKRDNVVDGAGYWACVQKIVDEEQRRDDLARRIKHYIT